MNTVATREIKQFDDSSYAENNKRLEESFNTIKEAWCKKIVEIVNEIPDTNKVIDAQVKGLSYRQIILEEMQALKLTASKIESKYDKVFKDRYREYSIYDIKLSSAEKQSFVKADISVAKTQLNILKYMIEYYEETIHTLDNINYAIKNRITLYDNGMI